MRERNIGLFIALILVGGCSAGEYQCRITAASSLETGQPVALPFIDEFSVRPDVVTDIYRAGEVFQYPQMGAFEPSTGNRVYPYVVFSKLDGKFDEMYMHIEGGAHVKGYCQKTGIL